MCAYEVFLSTPTHIDTSIDSTVCHLLSMIQASLEAAWQHARHLPQIQKISVYKTS